MYGDCSCCLCCHTAKPWGRTGGCWTLRMQMGFKCRILKCQGASVALCIVIVIGREGERDGKRVKRGERLVMSHLRNFHWLAKLCLGWCCCCWHDGILLNAERIIKYPTYYWRVQGCRKWELDFRIPGRKSKLKAMCCGGIAEESPEIGSVVGHDTAHK